MRTTIKLIAIVIAAAASFNVNSATAIGGNNIVDHNSLNNAHAAMKAYGYQQDSAKANNAAKGSIFGGMSQNVTHASTSQTFSNDSAVNVSGSVQQTVTHTGTSYHVAADQGVNIGGTVSQVVTHGSVTQRVDNEQGVNITGSVTQAPAQFNSLQRVENGRMVSIAGTQQTVANVLSVNENHAARPASINVSAASLKPSTPVSVTENGVTSITTAGAIAAKAPETQISVPHVPAFVRQQHTGHSHDKGSHNQGAIGHQGRGSENAQASAHNSPNGRAHGL